jgi:hypothetical protein
MSLLYINRTDPKASSLSPELQPHISLQPLFRIHPTVYDISRCRLRRSVLDIGILGTAEARELQRQHAIGDCGSMPNHILRPSATPCVPR